MRVLDASTQAKAAEELLDRGYAVLRGAFGPEAVSEMRALSDRMSRDAASILSLAWASGRDLAKHASERRDELIVVPEASDPTLVCRYEYMIGSNAKFRDLIRRTLMPVIGAVVREPVVPFKDKTNEKSSGGGAFRPHQDFAAYRFFPPRYHVTALVSIDPAMHVNGCVQFATNFREKTANRAEWIRTQEAPYALLDYYEGGPMNGDIVETATRQFSWEAIELMPADLVLFDSFVPHFSLPNESTLPRRAMFLTFNKAADGDFYETYYADKRHNYHDPKFHVSTPTLSEVR